MANAHRDSDLRSCGANTIVSGQSTVFVNDKLWSVDGDPNSHGGGNLIAGLSNQVFVEDKQVIVLGDSAIPDLALHPIPSASDGSGNVNA